MSLVLTFACAFGSARVGAAATFADAVTNGIINIPGLSEASGVAASRNNANVLWIHNDSGHPAVIYAIDTEGRLLGTYNTPGNIDSEDIAIGPGLVTNVSYIYVGDIGDNFSVRSSIKIYQIPEPAVYARQSTNPVTATPKGMRTITLTYPDGPRDAESLFVDPISGDLFILTKESTSRIYTATKSDLDTSTDITLTFLDTLAFQFPNSADISPSGNEIIVRRESLAEWRYRNDGQSISDALAGTAVEIPVTGPAGGEPNGEAIGFDAIGSGYFTLSDNAVTQPLRYFARTSNDGPLPPQVLVPAGASWKYLANGSNQGTAWRNAAFDDSGWSNGVAQLGYGDGDEQTVVSFGPNSNNKYITTYFRKKFWASDAANVSSLILKLVIDDGAAVYLNGTLVLRYGLATNAAYNTLATLQSDGLEDTWFSFPIDPHVLKSGFNTLAVEVHQGAVNSSDISFDLQLLATTHSVHEPFDYTNGTSLVLVTNSTGQWWSAAGTSNGNSNATVVAENLFVTGLAFPSAAAMQFGAVDGPSARFNLRSNITYGTLYYSFPFKVTSLGTLSTNGSWLAGFNNSRGTQSGTPTVLGTRILARATEDGRYNLGVAKNSTNAADFVWSPEAYDTDQIIFLVGSYTFNSNNSSDDISKLWINPSYYDFGASNPPAPTLVVTSGADMSANQIASFVFLQRGLDNANQPGAIIADELRIGTNWASVTPPGVIPPTLSAALMGTNFVLSWAVSYSDFVLEKASSFGPTSVWAEVLPSPALANGWFTATNVAVGSAFYRLRHSE